MHNILLTFQPKQTQYRLPFDPAIPLPSVFPRMAAFYRETCIPVFIAVHFTIAKKQPRCSETDGINFLKSGMYTQ